MLHLITYLKIKTAYYLVQCENYPRYVMMWSEVFCDFHYCSVACSAVSCGVLRFQADPDEKQDELNGN